MGNVPPAVLSATKNLRTRQSMLLGSDLEGGWTSPYPVGDNGTSFGPYQMHEGGLLTSLGLTPSQAENATTSTKAMLPVYQNAVNQISDQLWQTDPESAAEQAAVIAENPAQDYYASRGTGTVNAAWSNTTAALHGKKSTGGMPPVDANLTSAGEGPLGIATSIGGFLQSLASGNITGALGSLFSGTAGSLGDFAKQDLERAGLIIFGGLLVLVGVVVLALPAARTAATTAASIERGTGAIGKIGGTGGADPQDAARRQAIADRANSIGERKVALQEQREARLARSQYARQSSP